MSNGEALNEFDTIRPHVLALLKLHRAAETEEARTALAGMLEDAFLAASWHVARDLLENGWSPGPAPPVRRSVRRPHLRLVGGTDAA